MNRITELQPKYSHSPHKAKDGGRYLTERLPLATYLHATGTLPFLGCENTAPGKVCFLFTDPDHSGDKLELEFDRGAAVPATAIFASQRFLRRMMTEILNNRSNGVSHGFTTD